jgi:cob(I)alamin adenosyltransferase
LHSKEHKKERRQGMNEETKKELLKLGEKLTKESIESVFKIAEIEIKASENKIDDMALILLPQIKSFVLNAVDKIDGE